MIVMLVAVDDIFDVGRLEPEPADVGGDEIGTDLGPAVDQHVTVLAGQQQRGDPARPDIIGIAVDAHRRRRVVPPVPARALPRISGTGGRERRGIFGRRLGPAKRHHDLLQGEK